MVGVRRIIWVLWMILVGFLSLADAIPLIEAAKSGDENAARKILEKDPKCAQVRDDMGLTPLHWAAIRGHWFIVGHLLKADAPINAVAKMGDTPLMWACYHDAPDRIQMLLDRGADVSQANQAGITPLHVAARRGCLSVAQLLLGAGADPNAATQQGWTPLHTAYAAGHSNLVDLLLHRGAQPDRLDQKGMRPQDHAFLRPDAIDVAPHVLEDYVGIYDLGAGRRWKVWCEGGTLRIRERAPDQLVPVAVDRFFCQQEPQKATFIRDEAGAVVGLEVMTSTGTMRGTRLNRPHYVGSRVCQKCHLGRDTGNEYLQWVSSRHGAAYWRLATDWSKLLAGFRPAYRDMSEPIKESRCLWCHVTAAQDPDALLDPEYRLEEGVGCESCHGPGSQYIDVDVMKDKTRFLAHGGIVPDEQTCRRCHRNPERFDFGTWWPKIDHSRETKTDH